MTDGSDITSSSITLQSGTFSGSSGSGAFARATQHSGNTTVVDSTRTTTAGLSSSSETTTTMNADGSTTRDTVSTNAQGAMVHTDVTIGALQNGIRVITGTVTMSDGSVDQLNGALFPTSTGGSQYMLLTNADGATATSTSAFLRDGTSTTVSSDGSSFNGSSFDRSSTSTVLSSISAGAPADMIGGAAPAAAASFMPFGDTADTTGAFAAIQPTSGADLLTFSDGTQVTF